MVDVVRSCQNGKWSYIPVGMEKRAALLHSEHGPLATKTIKTSPVPLSSVLESIKDDGLVIRVGSSNGIIGFGKGNSHNEHLDAWYKQTKETSTIGLGNSVANKEIVMLLAASGLLVPGRWLKKGNLCAVEPVEPLPNRTFVLSEDLSKLISISMPHGFNGQIIPVYKPGTLTSWLATIEPTLKRFAISIDGKKFKITEANTPNIYIGEFKYNPDQQRDWFEIEKEQFEDALTRNGLSGVIGSYSLRKIKS